MLQHCRNKVSGPIAVAYSPTYLFLQCGSIQLPSRGQTVAQELINACLAAVVGVVVDVFEMFFLFISRKPIVPWTVIKKDRKDYILV